MVMRAFVDARFGTETTAEYDGKGEVCLTVFRDVGVAKFEMLDIARFVLSTNSPFVDEVISGVTIHEKHAVSVSIDDVRGEQE